MYPKRLNPSEPIPDVECLWCGEKHQYDRLMRWGCLVLEDTQEAPTVIWGAWCDQDCFNHWLDSPRPQLLFDE